MVLESVVGSPSSYYALLEAPYKGIPALEIFGPWPWLASVDLEQGDEGGFGEFGHGARERSVFHLHLAKSSRDPGQRNPI